MPIRIAARTLFCLLALLAAGLFAPGGAAPAAAQCTELIGCENPPPSAPGIVIEPGGGSWSASAASMQVVVTITWCDAGGMNPGNRQITLDGVSVGSAFGWTSGSMEGCATYGTSSGVVTLTPGTHTLRAAITNFAGVPGEESALYTYTQTAPPPPSYSYGVRVTPDAKPVTRGANIRSTERFVVANTGTGSMAVALAPSCTGAGVAWCGTSHGALTIPGGGIVSVGVNYSTGNAGSSGTVTLIASKSGDASVSDAGSHQVSVAAAPAAGQAGDPGELTAFDRSACLVLPAGLDAAYECGDLRLAHALPATRVLNKGFAPTLLYSSQHAYPYPIVGAIVFSPPPTLPNTVVATLTVAGQAPRSTTFDGWLNGYNRLAVGFDASGLPTGFYGYTFTATAYYPDGSTRSLYSGSGTLPIVNRSQSRFGRGWWLAGLEELLVSGNGSLMWVGGDGSTLRYNPVPGVANRWAAEPYAGTDTIVRLADGGYRRLIPGGDTVAFDAQGKHVRTASRRGHRTEFTWSGNALAGVSLPKGPAFDTGMGYVLEYANPYGMLSRVTAPSAGAPRVVAFENADGRVTAVSGPDTTSVRFGYADARPRISRRIDRRGVYSHWGYDAGSRLSSAVVTTGPGPSDYVPVYYLAQESRGIAATAANQIYTVFNGPRPDGDVADYTYFWVDRRGAPAAVQDAAGAVTRLFREDPRWPGVVTRVQYPNGREVTSSYDDAGRLSSTTDWGAAPAARYATTLYEWDERCSAVSRVTLPEGEVTSRGYNAQCMPEWMQPGHDPARRATVEYFPATHSSAPGLVSATVSPAPAPGGAMGRESYAYDGRGNLASVTTPLGITSYVAADAIGRDTLSRSPIEGSVYQRVRHQYDAMDRDTLTETIGPAMGFHPEQRLFVRTSYDAGGLTLSVSRWSSPDTAKVGTLTDSWKYDALRRAYLERRAAGSRDSLAFDEAGNVRGRFTSRSSQLGPITMRYDALNRLVERITPEASYAPSTIEIRAYVAATGNTQKVGSWTYPYYSNAAGGAFLIPADTARFVYDPLTGAMLEASNRDARVKRSYYADGALRTDSLRIRTWDGADFDQHRYGIEHVYDLNGRPVELRHPASIAPRNGTTGQLYDRETYGYDPATGALARVTSVLGHDFRFFQDLRGRADSTAYPGGVGEKLRYDADGRLVQSLVRGGSYSTDGTVGNLEYTYDLRGKRLSVGSDRGDVTLDYTGLGMLARAYGSMGPNTTGLVDEFYVYNALGHRVAATTDPQQTYPTYSRFRPGSGQLDRSDGPGNVAYAPGTSMPPADRNEFDAAGNLAWFHSDAFVQGKHDHTRHYYGADDRLRASERWTCRVTTTSEYSTPTRYDISTLCEPKYRLNSATAGSFEEYRYDALGRRVLVRSRRQAFCTHASCAGTMTRTVWNGDQILYEIRSPGDEGESAANLENDNVTGHPFWGRVAYTHGGGIDRPLEVIRIGYTPQPQYNGDYQLGAWGGPHPMILHTNWRGMVDRATTAFGRRMPCQNPLDCPVIRFPAATYKAYNQAADLVERQSWYGSLIEEKSDDSGLMYMRNRYYNPATGSFTQEDPIGIAGGLNTYGFANGDPASYSDPFGLSAVCCVLGMENVIPNIKAAGRFVLEYAKLQARGFAAGADVRRTSYNFDEEGQFGAILGRLSTVLPTARGFPGGTAAGAASLPDEFVVVRGGTGEMPPPGQVFSGAAGRTLEEAASGVPHGTIRSTTAGRIRSSGGRVRSNPEPTRSGAMNEKHVDICLGSGPCPFGEPTPNPVPKSGRVQ